MHKKERIQSVLMVNFNCQYITYGKHLNILCHTPLQTSRVYSMLRASNNRPIRACKNGILLFMALCRRFHSDTRLTRHTNALLTNICFLITTIQQEKIKNRYYLKDVS
jgi:hypothetical protein